MDSHGRVYYIDHVNRTTTWNRPRRSECSLLIFLWVFEQLLLRVESDSKLHWFCVASLCDWSRKLHRFLNQSDAKLKPSLNWSNMFSALRETCLPQQLVLISS